MNTVLKTFPLLLCTMLLTNIHASAPALMEKSGPAQWPQVNPEDELTLLNQGIIVVNPVYEQNIALRDQLWLLPSMIFGPKEKYTEIKEKRENINRQRLKIQDDWRKKYNTLHIPKYLYASQQ